MTIYSGAIYGDLILREGDDASGVTSVGGRLAIYADASLPALTSVGRDLHIHAGARLDVLPRVGRYLHIHAGARLDAPLLGKSSLAASPERDGLTAAQIEADARQKGLS